MFKSIAERKLLYTIKGKPDRKELVIRIGAPRLLTKGEVGFRFNDGTACCTIEFEGLPEEDVYVHGIDLIHALALAVDVDRFLKGMEKRYDFYWVTGEPYFEE